MLNEFSLTVLLAALPFTELRLALPIAITVFDLTPGSAYIASVIGNILPVAVILTVLPRCVDVLRKKIPLCEKFFEWWFSRVSNTYKSKLNRWGSIALLLFVAIPLPMTGAWTGSVAAYLFGINRLPAFIYIVSGVMIAGIIILLATLGIITFF